MATTTTRTKTTRKTSKGIGGRLTAKVGPLPVWAWALALLVVGYVIYKATAGKSSSGSTASTDSTTTAADAGVNDGNTTPAGGDSSGNPPASGQGGAADNLSADGFSQLTGLQGSVDALTAALQSATPFGGGDSGAGSTVPLDGTTWGSQPLQPATTTTTAAKTAAKPAATPSAPAHIRYYTYAPGKAPKGRAGDAAPARGPAGTTLHFARGKGYYYA